MAAMADHFYHICQVTASRKSRMRCRLAVHVEHPAKVQHISCPLLGDVFSSEETDLQMTDRFHLAGHRVPRCLL